MKIEETTTYSQVKFSCRESKVTEARNQYTFAVDELFGNVGAQRAPDSPLRLLVNSISLLLRHL